jgi:hypothetical protein
MQASLLETMVKCASFLTWIYFHDNEGRCGVCSENCTRKLEMEKFMQLSINERAMSYSRQTPPVINLNDFIKYLKKISETMDQTTEFVKTSKEIIKDFSYSSTIFNKLEDFLNIFFDNK